MVNNPQNSADEKSCSVPFFRPLMGNNEVFEVADTLNSGWLTTGPKVKRFETEFAQSVNNNYAVALNSCTAALHLAVRALGLKPNQGVLVPTMTFAATAEIVFYERGVPILVDCDPVTGNMDLSDAEDKINQIRRGKLSGLISPDIEIVGIIPVHVGGLLLDIDKIKEFAKQHNLWIVEDAAHAFPAAWRKNNKSSWKQCGSKESASVSCFSFYANKTITTGEGGMAVTDNKKLAEKIRMLSLHGLSRDAWNRFSSDNNSWDYRIVSPGYKYNLTDIAAAIGIHQLKRAESMREERQRIARIFSENFADIEGLESPPDPPNRIHSWHLYPVRLNLEKLSISRNRFIEKLKADKIGFSVHWRPLHLHPFYQETGWKKENFKNANSLWNRTLSLPIFPGMSDQEIDSVVSVVKKTCCNHSKKSAIRSLGSTSKKAALNSDDVQKIKLRGVTTNSQS